MHNNYNLLEYNVSQSVAHGYQYSDTGTVTQVCCKPNETQTQRRASCKKETLCGPLEVEKGRGDQSLLQARRIRKMLKRRTRIMYGPFKGPNAYFSERAWP